MYNLWSFQQTPEPPARQTLAVSLSTSFSYLLESFCYCAKFSIPLVKARGKKSDGKYGRRRDSLDRRNRLGAPNGLADP